MGSTQNNLKIIQIQNFFKIIANKYLEHLQIIIIIRIIWLIHPVNHVIILILIIN